MESLAILKVLFICSRNQWRSPTGELVWTKAPGLSVRSRGTSPRANQTLSAKDIDWADMIFVMEQKHKDRVRASFPRATQFKKIHVLDIPDEYQYGDPELQDLIRLSTEHHIHKALSLISKVPISETRKN